MEKRFSTENLQTLVFLPSYSPGLIGIRSC
jgi:hypothetical protein